MPEQPPEHLRRKAAPIGPDGEPVAQAAALSYEGGSDGAPKLVARGQGQTAERILELAREYHIPVKEDPTLVSILGALDVGAEVPPDLYGVIAEVLAWAYRADANAGARKQQAALRRAA